MMASSCRLFLTFAPRSAFSYTSVLPIAFDSPLLFSGTARGPTCSFFEGGVYVRACQRPNNC